MYFAPYPAGTPIYSAPMGQALTISVTLPSAAACYAAVKAYNGAGESPYSNIGHFILP